MASPLANKMAGVWCSLWKHRFQVAHQAQQNRGTFALLARTLDTRVLPSVGNNPQTCIALMTWYLNCRSERDMRKYASSVIKGFSLQWHVKAFYNEYDSNPNHGIFQHVDTVGPDEMGEGAFPEGYVAGMALAKEFETRDRMIVIEPGSHLEGVVQPVLAAAKGSCPDAR